MFRGYMDKRDFEIEFQRINNDTEMWVGKYKNKEIARIEYYKAMWLALDTLIRDYLEKRDTPLVTDYKHLLDAKRACETVKKVLDSRESVNQDIYELWSQYEDGLNTALSALDDLVMDDIRRREGPFVFDL